MKLNNAGGYYGDQADRLAAREIDAVGVSLNGACRQ
jgi:hypothetical protein